MKKILFTLVSTILLFTASFGQINSIERKSIVHLNIKEKVVEEVVEIGNEDEDNYYDKVVYKFTCDKEMPIFNSEVELIKFINENPEKTNGLFEVYIDDKLDYEVNIINGKKDLVGSGGGSYPCTYQGIRQCVREGIKGQNWLQYWECVVEGHICVIRWYANCAIDNC